MKRLPLCLSMLLLSACSGGGGGGNTNSANSTVIPATDVTLNKPENTPAHDNNVSNSESIPDVATSAEKPIHRQSKPVETTANDSLSVVQPKSVETTKSDPVPQPLPERATPDTIMTSPHYETAGVLGDYGAIYLDHLSVKENPDLKEVQQTSGTILIKIKGTDVEVLARSPKEMPDKKEISLLDSTVNKFVDMNGQLVGYYGKAATSVTENHRSGYAEDVTYHIENMFYAMDKNQAHLPDINANYQGTFYYYYNQLPQEATVALNYNDKKITGDIIGKGNNHHWEVDNQNNSVEDDGSFSVNLNNKSRDDSIKNGVLDGGFYGKQGEFVAGKAYNAPDDAQWAGVVGATRIEK